ncbi:MAG: hypothetical protein O2955_19625 [Planctomycetota bacterium]|nr:hypothetical protein [Planctomycetota bacterium]MDA1214724.1 hypothetical protein [Planctomycetota bacterium]
MIVTLQPMDSMQYEVDACITTILPQHRLRRNAATEDDGEPAIVSGDGNAVVTA